MRVLAVCRNCGLQSFLPAATKWKCPDCGHKLVRHGRIPLTEEQKRLGRELGRELFGSAPKTEKSICASCDTPHFGKCPVEHIPKKYDIVVFVHECDQWRPRKERA